MTPPKFYNTLIIESKDSAMIEMPGKEFKILLLKEINDSNWI
jgi:hypothetical protein